MLQARAPTAVLVALALTACSPALNWRSATIGEATVLMPCKPERAKRAVQMPTQAVQMEVVGCEAGGGLFAASHINLSPGADPQIILAHWYAATLANIGDTQTRPTPTQAVAGTAVAKPLAVTASGKDPAGAPIQARYLWHVGTREIVLLAIYAANITEEMAEPFLTDIKLQ